MYMYLLCTTNYFVRTTYHLMRTTNYLKRTTYHFMRTTDYLVRTTYHLMRTTKYLVRTTYHLTRKTYHSPRACGLISIKMHSTFHNIAITWTCIFWVSYNLLFSVCLPTLNLKKIQKNIWTGNQPKMFLRWIKQIQELPLRLKDGS